MNIYLYISDYKVLVKDVQPDRPDHVRNQHKTNKRVSMQTTRQRVENSVMFAAKKARREDKAARRRELRRAKRK